MPALALRSVGELRRKTSVPMANLGCGFMACDDVEAEVILDVGLTGSWLGS
jgi:hypothetical protein